ncbi:MAG: hypothetical protein RJA09_1677, partial [Pseudomonadota bacterium]
VLHAPLAALPSPMASYQTSPWPATQPKRHVVDRTHAYATAHTPTP